MKDGRVEYLLLSDGLDAGKRGEAVHQALALVAAEMGRAETDIPWSMRNGWPSEVVDAAARLCDRFVPDSKRDDHYMQTGVRSTSDPGARDDFISVAPHAYDATFWRQDYAEVASLSDEGTSCTIWLTDDQRNILADVVGADRVVSYQDWRRAHPSWWRRHLRRHKTRLP
ncbi:hypothetical protein ACXC9Q_32465 [Kribbella sp. CWNU-51]